MFGVQCFDGRIVLCVEVLNDEVGRCLLWCLKGPRCSVTSLTFNSLTRSLPVTISIHTCVCTTAH